MRGKSISIPAGMIFKKFYCHKCGEKLIKDSKKRIVKRGNADYREHNRIGHTNVIASEIEVTEYDFKCSACENVIDYKEQCVIEKIQKKLDNKILSYDEIENNRQEAERKLKIKEKIIHIAVYAVTLIIIGAILYSTYKNGDFSFDLNF